MPLHHEAGPGWRPRLVAVGDRKPATAPGAGRTARCWCQEEAMRRTVTWRLALPALAGMLMGPWPAGGAPAAGVGPWTAIGHHGAAVRADGGPGPDTGPHGGTVVALAAD